MALSLRYGAYGNYWGNDYNSSNALTLEQMQVNAEYIYRYFHDRGWTQNAVAGILGNMQVESTMNPGRWQSDRIEGLPDGHGYGCVQWTPYTKYTEWCKGMGILDPSTMDANLSRIMYEIENNIQWIATSTYDMTFEEFSKSTLDAGTLAKAFMLCYERPGDQTEINQNKRASNGNSWYEFLNTIDLGGGGYTPTKKKKFNFILFNRRRSLRG